MKRVPQDFKWLLKTPIAHRGLHNLAQGIPENSMAAFAAAVEGGFNIEIDVHLLADNNVAVFHDYSLKRMCGKNVDIRDLTARDLQDCYLAGTKERIPLLKDLLAFLNGRVGLLIEFKNNTPLNMDLERATVALLENYVGPVALQSFNPLSVKHCRKKYTFPVGQLATWRREGKRSSALNFMGKLTVIKESKPDFVAYDILDIYDNPYVDKVRDKKNLPFIAWTVRNPEQLKTARDMKVNVIFENLVFERPATKPQPTPDGK